MTPFRELDDAYANESVKLCISAYNSLPKTGKPSKEEWTVISAVVEENSSKLRVVSLGTGSKCIGRSFLRPQGNLLNDSHAEVVARRGFLCYLYNEILSLHQSGQSAVFCDLEHGKVSLKKSVRFGFVSSIVPCGDAAIIPVDMPRSCNKTQGIGTNSTEESTPRKRLRLVEPKVGDIHRTGAKCLASEPKQDMKLPGSDYHVLGAVRTKPGRGDPTASVSCSDKIARWNSVGIQGALLSMLLDQPIELQFLVIGGGSPFSLSSLERALNERVGTPKKIALLKSHIQFPVDRNEDEARPAPSSIAWNIASRKVEVSVEGRRLGTTKKNVSQSAVEISKCKIMQRFLEVVKYCKLLQLNSENVQKMTYRQLKNLATDYQSAWKTTRESYFKVWTEKPPTLEDFTSNS